MRLRIGGAVLEIGFGFLAVMALFVMLGGRALALLTAAALHEAGHLAALYCCGGRLERMRFGAFGIQMTPRCSRMLSTTQEMLISFAGPAAGLLTAAAAHLAGDGRFAAVNLALALFNLLPLRGLDGFTLLELLFGPAAEAYARAALLMLAAALGAALLLSR